ncbi:MAG: sigma-70 region 4 domain protein [Nocardioides sp.]|nr:sigma-70 region 4 domain protein [Nocardioides sp.]
MTTRAGDETGGNPSLPSKSTGDGRVGTPLTSDGLDTRMTEQAPSRAPGRTAAADAAGDTATRMTPTGARGGLTTLSRSERAERTRDLLARARTAEAGLRAELLDTVVILNCRVADAVAQRYQNRGAALEDLRQTAYEGLVKAVQRYDPASADNLLTYAVPTMRGEIQRFLRDRVRTMRLPRRTHELDGQIRATVTDLTGQLGREPDAAEVCAALDITREEYDEVQATMDAGRPLSLDVVIGDDAGGAVLGDVVQVGPHETYDRVEDRAVLEHALDGVGQRDRQVLFMRFYEQQTQSEIGERLGISGTEVGRRLERILRRLRASIVN